MRNATFVESRAERFDKSVNVLGGKELAVTTDAGSVVDKRDEPGLDRGNLVLDKRAVGGHAGPGAAASAIHPAKECSWIELPKRPC